MTQFMAMTQHPTMDTLLSYMEAPEQASFRDLRLHIAACSDCRGNIVKLNAVQKTLQQTGTLQSRINTPSAQLAEALKQQSIERYVDGELQDQHAAQIKTLLESDAIALKAALHYASHSHHSAKLRQQAAATSTTSHSVSPQLDKTHTLLNYLKNFFDFRPPLWISAPATAAIVLIMASAIMPSWLSEQSPDIAIATYQDKAVIHFQGAGQLPGIGFFSKAHSSTQAYGPMKINYSYNHNDTQNLSLQWPQVANAKSYHLTLYLIAEGQKITVKELDLTTSHALIKDFKPTAGKRYEWALNGETNDAKSFYTSGGFVINRP